MYVSLAFKVFVFQGKIQQGNTHSNYRSVRGKYYMFLSIKREHVHSRAARHYPA
jgi:hypothetical protein